MPRYVDGLPVDTGASDSQDSARLAGMMALAGLINYCNNYMVWSDRDQMMVGTRHPTDTFQGANNPDKFSRDQMMCLVVGVNNVLCFDLYKGAVKRNNTAQNWMEDGGKPKWYGADKLIRLNMDVVALKANHITKLSKLGYIQLIVEILFKRIFNSLGEPNQILSMAQVSRNFALVKKLWPKWEQAVDKYWCGWRGEPELAAAIKDTVKKELYFT